MRKNETIICVLSLALAMSIVFYFIKIDELNLLSRKKNNLLAGKSKIEKLAKDISGSSFHTLRRRNIVASKTTNLKNIVRTIAQKSKVKNVLFKKTRDANCENIEIKFSADYERNVYDFINAIRTTPNEAVIFDEIKILKNGKNDFISKIKCKLFLFNNEIAKTSISVRSSSEAKDIIATKSLRLFPRDDGEKLYTLYCVANNSKAYVNNAWMSVGDKIGDFEIKHINHDSVDIWMDGELVNIRLGKSWH